ncbi:MAG: glycosyltransferase, partial [Gemmatimonadota bacterium]|nr:glycosyltransferase [Gemmatimonadota bacterium]
MAILLPVVPWLLAAIALVRLGRRRPRLDASPPATSPRVSVIVPARNESGSIETVIRSVLGSTYPDLELIVVDDRSTDDTADQVARLAQSDPRLRLVAGEELPPGW